MTEDESHRIQACTEALMRLARGESPAPLNLDCGDVDPEIAKLCEAVSSVVAAQADVQEFMRDLAGGDLNRGAPVRNQFFAPFKELQANLRHLVWQARQIADGDLSQSVDFLGDFSVSFNSLIASLKEKQRVEEEIRFLNVQLGSAIRRLESANEELESFSYSVSHDLRSPLRHMSGFATLLMKKVEAAPTDDKMRHYASAIVAAVKKMEVLIDDLLDFSRLGRMEMKFLQVELNVLIRDTLDEIQWQTENRIIEWKIAALPGVYGDATLLGLAVTNLLSNAVKFTQPRSTAVIEVGCEAGDGEFTFFVRDNGVGFNIASAPRLFALFQRLHPQKDFEGTGVGLANVRRIISRHGGRTWAEGVEGKGATFYFTLPAGRQEAVVTPDQTLRDISTTAA